jgi:hypothetical protein
MAHHHLKLNGDKTEVLVITTPQSRNHHSVTEVRIGDCVIRPTPVARNIGVMFDDLQSMGTQVRRMCQTAYYHLHRIHTVRDCLTQQAAERLVLSLVISRLDYGNALLHGLPGQLLNKLQLVQNSAARVITRTGRYEHITPVLKQLHWLPIRFRIQYKIILLTFRALHNLAPAYISDLVECYQPTRTLRSSSGSLLTTHTARLRQYGDRSFWVAAPLLWNDLPRDIRECDSINCFKKVLKTHLFKKAYNC